MSAQASCLCFDGLIRPNDLPLIRHFVQAVRKLEADLDSKAHQTQFTAMSCFVLFSIARSGAAKLLAIVEIG